MASAMSSLPVPLSPAMSTLARLWATCSTSSSSVCIFGESPTMWPIDVALAQPLAEAHVLLEEPRLLHRALDDRRERLEVERLREVVVGALLDGVDRAGDGAERGHHDEHGAGQDARALLHEPDAVEPRHLEVGQDDVRRELVELAERLEAVGRGLGRVTRPRAGSRSAPRGRSPRRPR